MTNRQQLQQVLKADLARFDNRKPNLKDLILCNEVWYIYHFIRYMRLIEYYQDKGFIYKIHYLWCVWRYKRLSHKIHIIIYPGTIGPGFRIYHIGGFTHVGNNVKIGKNCTMQPGVVFGNKTEKEDNGQVTVGDNCYFGLNAKILGPVRIGNNVTVGANAVVTKDIQDNAIVGGVPARIIKNNG